MAKASFCFKLKQAGREFITEAEFDTGPAFKKRADIVSLDEGICYEILHTETEAKFSKKLLDYPLKVVPIKAEDFLGTLRR